MKTSSFHFLDAYPIALYQETIYVVAALCLLIFISEWLCRHTFLRHVGSTLLVILLGAIFANLGLIPTASNSSPVYSAIFKYVAPLSIFYLLLGVNLKAVRKAGGPMLLAFGAGAVGTMIGVWMALHLIDYEVVFGENYRGIAGMMTGTYIGGSANFNALALHYGILQDGPSYTGMIVADNIITAVWMLVTLILPLVMNRLRPHQKIVSTENPTETTVLLDAVTTPLELSLLLSMGLIAVIFADRVALAFGTAGFEIPGVLILTTIALLLAQWKRIQQLPAANLMGIFAVNLFLVVVGAFCELKALTEVGERALDILLFTSSIVVCHGAFLVLIGLIFKMDWNIVAIASQANIGGAGTALALARSFDRDDLLLPAILVGSLGTGLGTYLGFLVAALV